MYLENDRYLVEISTHGAELHRFFDKQLGLEYIWKGDPNYWSYRTPILFPIVGHTFSGNYVIDGVAYSMGNHGFARDSDFSVLSYSNESVVLHLLHSEESLKMYPFKFDLIVEYVLEQNRITLKATVINLQNKEMPFNLGFHPAFKCPIDPTKRFEDYYIEFEKEEMGKSMENLVPDITKRINMGYPTNEQSFGRSYHDLDSKTVSLTDGVHRLILFIEGFKWFIIWNNKHGDFICLEPLHSHGDRFEVKVPFEKREGTITLGPWQRFQTSFYIEVS